MGSCVFESTPVVVVAPEAMSIIVMVLEQNHVGAFVVTDSYGPLIPGTSPIVIPILIKKCMNKIVATLYP